MTTRTVWRRRPALPLLLLLLLLGILAASCGGDDEEAAAPAQEAPAEEAPAQEAPAEEAEPATESEVGEPIKLAHYSALTGQFSAVGTTLDHALQIEVDRVNAAGGIPDANGTRHLIEYDAYDNNFYEPAAQLRAVKKSILEDGKEFSIGTYTTDAVKATAPFVTEQKHLHLLWGLGPVDPDSPFVVATQSGAFPAAVVLNDYLINEVGLRRWAFMFEDTAIGQAREPWERVALEINGIEPVFNARYARGTKDFIPILSSVLKEDPDVIALGPSDGATQALIVQTAKQLGYEGHLTSTEWFLNDISQKVDLDFLTDKAWFQQLDYRSEGAPQETKEFFEEYAERYGADEWQSFSQLAPETLQVLEIGIQNSTSVDPEAVAETLLSLETIDHPVFGTGSWWGEELFGANQILMTPSPISTVRDGNPVFVQFGDFLELWEANKDVMLKFLREAGVAG